jgi:hypothetical protein
MEETMKVVVVVGSAILVGMLGMVVKGAFGAVMGFVLTIVIIAFFSLWKNMKI